MEKEANCPSASRPNCISLQIDLMYLNRWIIGQKGEEVGYTVGTEATFGNVELSDFVMRVCAPGIDVVFSMMKEKVGDGSLLLVTTTTKG